MSRKWENKSRGQPRYQGNGKISLEDSQGITKIQMGFYKHWIRIQVPQLRTKQMIDEPDPGCKYWPALSPVVAYNNI